MLSFQQLGVVNLFRASIAKYTPVIRPEPEIFIGNDGTYGIAIPAADADAGTYVIDKVNQA